VGVTSQNEALRKRFPGTPDNVVTFFGFVAEEVRHILARLGFTSLDEVIGRPGLLEARAGTSLKKTTGIDITYLLDSLSCAPEHGENLCDFDIDRTWLEHGEVHSNGHTFDDDILNDPEVREFLINYYVYMLIFPNFHAFLGERRNCWS
jgi:glutamate synthase (ferredoxin)